MRIRFLGSRTAFLAFVVILSTSATAQEFGCGGLNEGFGPFDYRTVPANTRKRVEDFHFTPRVEYLRGGKTSESPGGDISYTLRSMPNHHRALMSMMKLAEREKRDRPRGSLYSMACWFDRAERYQPDDAMVKALHGIYLSRKGKKKEALEKLNEVLVLGVPSPNIDYNMGLVFFDLGEYEKSLQSAHRAYAAGFNLPGLKAKLKRAGKWQEPPNIQP